MGYTLFRTLIGSDGKTAHRSQLIAAPSLSLAAALGESLAEQDPEDVGLVSVRRHAPLLAAITTSPLDPVSRLWRIGFGAGVQGGLLVAPSISVAAEYGLRVFDGLESVALERVGSTSDVRVLPDGARGGGGS